MTENINQNADQKVRDQIDRMLIEVCQKTVLGTNRKAVGTNKYAGPWLKKIH